MKNIIPIFILTLHFSCYKRQIVEQEFYTNQNWMPAHINFDSPPCYYFILKTLRYDDNIEAKFFKGALKDSNFVNIYKEISKFSISEPELLTKFNYDCRSIYSIDFSKEEVEIKMLKQFQTEDSLYLKHELEKNLNKLFLKSSIITQKRSKLFFEFDLINCR